MYYVVLVREPMEAPGLSEVRRISFSSRAEAEKAIAEYEKEGKEAFLIYRGSFRTTSGPDGIIQEIERLP